MAAAFERAGFTVEAVLQRAPHPDESETHRSYVLARRTSTA